VARVDPESTGLNPAWRKSLVYSTLGTFWKDGANITEIDAARQLLIQDMKILEGIAPDSGAYLNEVRIPNVFLFFQTLTGPARGVGFEIRIRLEEILLRRSLQPAPGHQAEIRSGVPLRRLRGYWIRGLGRRSHLQGLKPLRTLTPTGFTRSVAWWCGRQTSGPFTIHDHHQDLLIFLVERLYLYNHPWNL
jgi:hypothetical protein